MTTERRPLARLTSLSERALGLGTIGLSAVLATLLAAGFLSTPAGAQENPHGDLDRACTDCHTVDSWSPLKADPEFDHGDTGFPLAASHRQVECMSCHGNLRFQLVPTSCFDCHDDPHIGEMGFDCDSCHIPAGWENRGELFDRHSASLFPLTGAHAFLDCESCHREEPPFEFSNTPIDCFGCHSTDYEAAVPDHVSSGFPIECEACHTTRTWLGADFDHEGLFPLRGAHRVIDCTECHTDGFVPGLPTDCYGCHKQDYEATTDPDHVAASFPTMCEECHDENSWQGADFNHEAVFPLTGGHRGLDCEACHADGFAGTPTDCFSCHKQDYDATSDPDHAQSGFPTMCEECHNTSDWNDADFDHDSVFPLTGGHRNLDCDACHADGFAGTPTDCFACHKTDYDNTNDPNHAGAGFPTMCEDCHNTTDWNDADFDHNMYFPLQGDHNLDCSECHVVTSNFKIFECIECHDHSQAEMADEHDEVGGYVWESQACLECHPDGRE